MVVVGLAVPVLRDVDLLHEAQLSGEVQFKFSLYDMGNAIRSHKDAIREVLIDLL